MDKMKYTFFTSKEIKPRGWLKTELEIQASGLCGNLDKVWRDVRDSAWIGGDSDGWERVPYWLDGFIPLAYLLEDEDMISRAKRYVESIMSAQKPDGWICPCPDDERGDYDVWAALLIAKVLCLYGDCSGDERAFSAVKKCLKQLSGHLDYNTLRNWGAARWFEGLIPIYRLYEICGEEWLVVLAKKLRVQGFDWERAFREGLIDDCAQGWDYISHVVNIAMMLKSEALWSLFGDGSAQAFADAAAEYLDKKHGAAAGHYNGDENLSGNSPVQGAELCSVVELMYSYEILFAVTGDTKWLDRLEQIGFNSLPAALAPDMWTHQYDQMTNQAACYPMKTPTFRTNNNEAHIFGLEPNFGCCTANFGQGFPKLALSSFFKAEDGIAACALVPAVIKTSVNGTAVSAEIAGGYPFEDSARFIICADKPVEFCFYIRVPIWAKSAKIDGKNALPGSFFRILKRWSGKSVITAEFEFETQLVKRPEDMVCVRRGPLIFSIPIEEKWERVEYEKDGVERRFPYCDYHIYPQSEWNYAIAGSEFETVRQEAEKPFDAVRAPIAVYADAVRIDWGFEDGHVLRAPRSREPLGAPERIRLIPYGCTNLRMTEVPFIKDKKTLRKN